MMSKEEFTDFVDGLDLSKTGDRPLGVFYSKEAFDAFNNAVQDSMSIEPSLLPVPNNVGKTLPNPAYIGLKGAEYKGLKIFMLGDGSYHISSDKTVTLAENHDGQMVVTMEDGESFVLKLPKPDPVPMQVYNAVEKAMMEPVGDWIVQGKMKRASKTTKPKKARKKTKKTHRK